MVAIPAGFDPEAYLQLEEQASIRHEFRLGSVYAMAGGSANHNRIAINLVTALNLHFSNDRCQFFSGDVKLNYAERFYYYPDVFVTCDPRDFGDLYRGTDVSDAHPTSVGMSDSDGDEPVGRR